VSGNCALRRPGREIAVDPKAFITSVEACFKARTVAACGKRLTALHVRIASKLAFWRGAHPKHRQLARAAGCSSRTVRRALAILHSLLLLSWDRRVVTGKGWRAQTANAYALGSKKEIGYQNLISSVSLSAPAQPVTRQGDLLLARQRTIHARLLAGRYGVAAAIPLASFRQ
jgi:hypothetical protein